MTRQDAKRAGLAFYENGKPCRHGHVAARYTNKGACVVCERARGKKYDPARRRELMDRNPSLYAEIMKRHRKTAKFKARNAANAALVRAEDRLRKATPPWADLRAIKAIYERATLLSAETGVRMSVDHEIPLRGKLVSGLHVESNLRIIPLTENKRKNNRFEVYV